jgi:hypothetical protein
MSPVADTPLIADPNKGLTWENLLDHLVRKYSLPENARLLGEQTPEEKAHRQVASVLGAFRGFPKSRILAEGTKLLRATSFRDPYKRRNEPEGHWWFPETLLLDLLSQFESELRSNSARLDGVRRKLRSLLAISDSFSDVEQLWYIQIPAGAQLTVLEGPAFQQPVDSSLAGSYLSMGELPGGGWQYYLEDLPAIQPKEYSLHLLPGMWLRNPRGKY